MKRPNKSNYKLGTMTCEAREYITALELYCDLLEKEYVNTMECFESLEEGYDEEQKLTNKLKKALRKACRMLKFYEGYYLSRNSYGVISSHKAPRSTEEWERLCFEDE